MSHTPRWAILGICVGLSSPLFAADLATTTNGATDSVTDSATNNVAAAATASTVAPAQSAVDATAPAAATFGDADTASSTQATASQTADTQATAVPAAPTSAPVATTDTPASSAPSATADASAPAASATDATPDDTPARPKNMLDRSLAKINEIGSQSIASIDAFGNKMAVDANAAQPEPVKDPFEHFNRKMFSFNSKLDQYILLPIASRYDRYVPQPIHSAITQFFVNLGTPWVAVNNLLQGHPGTSISSLSRFVINSATTLGFYDTASWLGVEKSSTDFGVTLGKWGIGSGPFLMLPFLGPSTVRDGLASIPDQLAQPQNYLKDQWITTGLTAVKFVDVRANLIGLEHFVQGDQYTLIRDLYLQNRQFKVNGTNPAASGNDSFGDDGFGDDSSKSAPDASSTPATASPPSKDGSSNLTAPSSDTTQPSTASASSVSTSSASSVAASATPSPALAADTQTTVAPVEFTSATAQTPLQAAQPAPASAP